MPVFRRLRTKLTVLYAALFGAALVLVSCAVAVVVYTNAVRLVRGELQASATVFDRTWELRSRQLQDGAALLAGDFGFREAVATGDAATIRSAAENLRGRLDSDLALIVGLDGRVTSSNGRALGPAATDLRAALEAEQFESGVFVLDGAPYQATWAPILSPALSGWVVFALRLDEAEMASLERLSAIPLQATVLDRRTGLAGEALDMPAGEPRLLRLKEGMVLALAKPLRSLSDGAPLVLMLRYPLADALRPYHPLIAAIFLVGAAGMVLLVLGSWTLARTITRPISDLDEAARRLERGEPATVDVRSDDEVGRLAQSFNTMAAGIQERERRIRDDADRLAAALDRAEAANRATNEFLANMSHELRTPLNGVLGFAQVLATADLQPLQKEMVIAIESSASSLERLLSDLLEAARLRAGGIVLEDEPFALAAAVRAVADAWAAPAAEKGLSLVTEVAAAAETNVRGDVARVRQIIDVLVGNAVKFTERGEVRVSVAAGPHFRIEVRDTGVGFDPELEDRLFAPFQQVDGSSTRRFGGAGLGLSMAADLTRLMAGRIGAEGRPGEGAAFWVELPLPPAEAAPAVPRRRASA